MGSHSVTCHPTQVNAPRHNPSQPGRYSVYLPRGMEGWVDLGSLIAARPGPTTAWSQVRRPITPLSQPSITKHLTIAGTSRRQHPRGTVNIDTVVQATETNDNTHSTSVFQCIGWLKIKYPTRQNAMPRQSIFPKFQDLKVKDFPT